MRGDVGYAMDKARLVPADNNIVWDDEMEEKDAKSVREKFP